MITVLLVEDSPVVRESLVEILGAAPGIQVIGTANDGRRALSAAGFDRYNPARMEDFRQMEKLLR